jgi:hypothetical protein
MVEITSDRPLFKTILVEMAYSVIHLHNQVNKSKITVFSKGFSRPSAECSLDLYRVYLV